MDVQQKTYKIYITLRKKGPDQGNAIGKQTAMKISEIDTQFFQRFKITI